MILPRMVSGTAGAALVLIDTLKFFADDVPQKLVACTLIVPPVELAVVVMLSVPELPVHPDGKLQIYEVAPDTWLT
jgi:hypothetical protein